MFINNKSNKRLDTSLPLASLLLLVIILSFSLFPLTMANDEQPKYGGTFISTVNGDPHSLNPAIDTSPVVVHAAGPVFNSLCEYGFDMKPRPELAESWEISQDGLTFTFHLVRNATWHDGEQFTSADVKFTYEEVLGQLHPRTSKSLTDALDSIETPDNYTAVFKLNYPFAPFMSILSTSEGSILPKHLYEGTDILDNEYNAKPIGTGPFKFKEWVKGSHITLEKNENYWRKGRPYLDKVVIQVIPDSSARVLSLKKGEVDYLWYTMLPDSEIDSLKELPEFTVTDTGLGWGTPICQIWTNLRRPYLEDITVRKAIAYAVDNETINALACFGLGKPAISPIMSDCWAHNPDVTVYEHDLEKANSLLDEAGYSKNTEGMRFELELTTQLGSWFERVSEAVKSQLAEVGIKVRIQLLEYATMIEKVHMRWDFDLFIQGAGTGPDPAIGVARFYNSKNIKHMPWANIVGYNNSRVDWLLDQAEKTVDVEKRREYYNEFQEIVTEELPYVWLLERPVYTAFRKEFVGLHSWSAYSYMEFEDVWWTKGEAITQYPYMLPEIIVAVVVIGGIVTSVIFLRRRRHKQTQA